MRIDFTPDPQLYPFESRWFDSSHGRIHYVDEGNGPPILLCHGNPTWSFLYRDIIVQLRDRFRCIAPDYLGFGLSDRPSGFGYKIDEHAQVVGEFVDHLGLDGYLSMGQDWGGPISMAVDVERADRVRGIVLGNKWFWPTDEHDEDFQPGDVQSPNAVRDPATEFLCQSVDSGGYGSSAKLGGDGALPRGAAQR
jgi:haloalkane dehalogenase